MNEQTPTAIDCSFRPFPKMPRLSREIVITEKIDGTNAQLLIVPSSLVVPSSLTVPLSPEAALATVHGDALDPKAVTIFVGSRTRWITPGKQTDNHGFAGWVRDNATELAKLGPGRHFGEWWGCGINRNYGLNERRLSLFNVARWAAPPLQTDRVTDLVTGALILGVTTAPVLYRGEFDTGMVESVCDNLRTVGSYAKPGFMDPEGIVIWHTAANHGFKKTLKDDEAPKSVVASKFNQVAQ